MARRFWRSGPREDDPRDAPEADLVEEPIDQRTGDEPEDLLRTTDREQAERDRELRDSG